MAKQLETYLEDKNVQAFLALIRYTLIAYMAVAQTTKSKTYLNQTLSVGVSLKLMVRKTLRLRVVHTSS